MSLHNFSVVEYFSEREGQQCGYCKSHDSYISCGMWAHSISEMEYQNLIDRGWRRSGRYMYKPLMSKTCCPMYTIRCEVGDLKISKSQKKVLKKFYNHLRFGDTPRDFHQPGASSDISSMEGDMSADVIPSHMEHTKSQPAVVELDKIEMDTHPSKEDTKERDEEKGGGEPQRMEIPGPSTEEGALGAADASGDQPRPRKAKLIRLENKYNKLRKRGMSEEEAIRLTYEHKKSSQERRSFSFEGYFPTAEEMSYCTHKFRTELVPVSHLENDEKLLLETHRLYVKYQAAVHGDSPEDCSLKQLIRFLIDSPIYDSHPSQGPPCGFGSFHQQYWRDDRLIAVGVIDILPKCVSSVYFFYDPELRSLSLGTYGSLREMFFTRSLTEAFPSIKYYYLGYYIHSCPKMNYKGRYCPSHLLCPETYTWHRIEKCRPMLEKSKYSRFETNLRVKNELQCEVNLVKVMILHKNRAMGYHKYKRLNPAARDEEEVTEYARLVGEECHQSLLLYRK